MKKIKTKKIRQGEMSYRREGKQRDLREARVGEALVARRPTQNTSLSTEKKENIYVILSIPIAHCNQPLNLFLTYTQQIYNV
jgi:hypothetical protein